MISVYQCARPAAHLSHSRAAMTFHPLQAEARAGLRGARNKRTNSQLFGFKRLLKLLAETMG